MDQSQTFLSECESNAVDWILSEIPPRKNEGFRVDPAPAAMAGLWFSHGPCHVCNHHIWLVDAARGDYVCRGCGAVQDGVRIGCTSVKEREQAYSQGHLVRNEHLAAIGEPGPCKRSRSAPYKRITYFSERISQWAQCEPEIPEDDWHWILDAYNEWCFTNKGRYPRVLPTPAQLRTTSVQIPGTFLLTKEEVRSLLVLVETRDYSQFIDFEDDRPKVGHYVKKYYEKWLTIRWRLSGERSMACEVPDWVFAELKSMFQALQPAFWQCIYDTSSRKSFPSYNFVICRLLDLLGFSECNVDFPCLKTDAKRKKLQEYWHRICKFMQWPYINSQE